MFQIDRAAGNTNANLFPPLIVVSGPKTLLPSRGSTVMDSAIAKPLTLDVSTFKQRIRRLFDPKNQ